MQALSARSFRGAVLPECIAGSGTNGSMLFVTCCGEKQDAAAWTNVNIIQVHRITTAVYMLNGLDLACAFATSPRAIPLLRQVTVCAHHTLLMCDNIEVLHMNILPARLSLQYSETPFQSLPSDRRPSSFQILFSGNRHDATSGASMCARLIKAVFLVQRQKFRGAIRTACCETLALW